MTAPAALERVRKPVDATKELRKALASLTGFVGSYLILVDAAMKMAPHLRGPRLADLANKLEMKNDMTRRFVLGQSLKPKKPPRKMGEM